MPVAAYPVTGPIDVIGHGVTGVLDVDLGLAAARALSLDPRGLPEAGFAVGLGHQRASSKAT